MCSAVQYYNLVLDLASKQILHHVRNKRFLEKLKEQKTFRNMAFAIIFPIQHLLFIHCSTRFLYISIPQQSACTGLIQAQVWISDFVFKINKIF